VVALLCVIAQMTIFSIGLLEASLAVALSFGLAVVAARVSGETGIPPIGAMGKITQLTFALVSPGNATANLMSANVTGGAASQCSDMLHDLKAGHLLGAWPRHQAIAQAFGVSAGCLAGCTGYLLLVPMPERQLMTSQWPAPAVAQWKAVAELFTEGASHLPPGALIASLVAATLGVALVVLERVLPKNWQSLVPSAPSIGLAMVIPAYYSLGALAGSMLAVVSSRVFPRQSARYTIVVGAGLVAGEGLTGVLLALLQMAGAP
jgi:uncharacterized oligopeptide transporter (OPT) family protein